MNHTLEDVLPEELSNGSGVHPNKSAEPSFDTKLRHRAATAAVLGVFVLATFFFGLLVYHAVFKTSTDGRWLLKVIETHFAATIAVPLSGVSALCIVLMLKATADLLSLKRSA
jgi:hypothetical protein